MFDILTNPKRRKSLFAYIILGLICLVFVFMDAGSFLTGAGGGGVSGYAARVNNSIISLYEHRSAMEQITRYYSSIYGDQFGSTSSQRQQIAQEALRQLISKELVNQAANEQGLYVSDLEVAQTIREIPFLQEDGVFQKTLYDAFLQNRRISAGQFEKDLRKDLMSQKIRDYFASAIVVSPLQEAKEEKMGKYRRQVSYVAYNEDLLAVGQKVNTKDAEEILAKKAQKDEIQNYFQENKDDYSQKEQVRASHILFRAQKPEEMEAALEKAKGLKAELKPENFAQKAKSLSEDPGTKEKGGDLGFFTKGAMVPQFEEVAFNLEVGEISEPVKTPFGYHLIYLEGKKEAKQASFEEVKLEVAKQWLAKQNIKAYEKEVEAALKDQNANKVDKLLKQVNLKWTKSPEFSLEGEELGALASISNFLPKAFQLTKDKPFIERPLLSGEKKYIVKLEKAYQLDKLPKTKPPQLRDISLGRQLSMNVMQSWLENLSKNASIETNEQALRN